jgi:hypothetical protein
MDPIEQKYRDHMNKVMAALTQLFPGTGVALLVFEFGDAKRINWISNADRTDMIAAMKEFIARNEGTYQPAPEAKQ